MFFIISGFFISCKGGIKEYSINKIKQLLVPYILVTVCIALIKGFQGFYLYNDISILTDTLLGGFYGSAGYVENLMPRVVGVGALWFLLAMSISIITVKSFIDCKYGYIYVGILAYISVISAKYIILPLSIQAGMSATVFVYLGFILKEYNWIDTLSKKQEIIISCFSIVLLLFVYRYNLGINMAFAVYPLGIFNYLVAIIVSIGVILISKMFCIADTAIKRILRYIGKNSLFILCFHEIEGRDIDYKPLFEYMCSYTNEIVAFIIVFLIKVIISVLGVVVLNGITNVLTCKRKRG